jgi:hypothetical protein
MGSTTPQLHRFSNLGIGERSTMMKWLMILCGLLLAWGMLPDRSAVAGPESCLEVEQARVPEAVGPTASTAEEVEQARVPDAIRPTASTAEIVVVISGSPDSAGSEVVVKGGPSQSVRVIAPANVNVTAIGGDGAAGTPGTPGN